MGVWTSIGGWLWKTLLKPAWDWIKGIFGFKSDDAKDKDSEKGVLGFLLGLVKGIWKWFKGLFGFDTKDTTEAEVDTKPGGIGGMLLKLIQGVWGWFKGLFSWGTDKEPAEGEDSKKGILGFLTSHFAIFEKRSACLKFTFACNTILF